MICPFFSVTAEGTAYFVDWPIRAEAFGGFPLGSMFTPIASREFPISKQIDTLRTNKA